MRMTRIGGIAGIVLTSVLPGSAASAAASSIVRTSAGAVRGLVAGDHQAFLGIPYAAPPTGKLRWRAPRPAAPWAGTRDATRPGPVCPQESADGSGVTGSEDCLNLNVWTPAGRAAHRPIIVWIHGGGYVLGAGSQYDPTRLVTQGTPSWSR